ncbi:MAG: glycosyltransferase family 2 protein [Caldiserica bacterium]|nr:glycosyltransferase family 2 protein [Caldisericota bacterium]
MAGGGDGQAGYKAAATDVSVALCTFNGALYLREQLDSLLGQTSLPTELVLSDDGSSDASVSIVTEFARSVGMRLVVAPTHARLGVVQNFNLALSLCSRQYVALSDQDDVWLPDKLTTELAAMHEGEARYGTSCPLLVHSDLTVVSADLRPISSSFMRTEGLRNPSPDDALTILLTQNFVTGCTMLVNRPLLECALPIPREAVIHDWWLALIAASCGHVLYVDQPTIMYRQHDSNAIGVDTMAASLKRIIAHPASRLKHGMAMCTSCAHQLDALESRITECHAETATIEHVHHVKEAIARGGVRSAGRLLSQHVRRLGPFRTAAWYLLCALKGPDSSR